MKLAPSRAWLAGAFFLIFCCTRGYFLGDTTSYVSSILNSFPAGPANVLWEFGHLLWRPLGWLLLRISAPVLISLTGWEPEVICSLGLIGINVISGFLTVLLWYSLALKTGASRSVAFSIAAGFACANSFLAYIHSGASYVPGLFFVTLAIWLARNREGATPSPGRVAAGASAAALATLLWFPYVLAVPGILLATMWPWNGPAKPQNLAKPETMRLMAHFVLVFLLWLGVGFGIGAWARGIHSVAESRSWIARSEHGFSQTERVKRLATGIPRSFLYLGDDAILYRRFLRKDPYAPVSLIDLARGSIWKIAAFGLFAAGLIYELLRGSKEYWALWLVAAGSVPVLLFAVTLFEPTSPERYFPALPFLIIGVAWSLRDFPNSRRPSQLGIAAFLACMAITNLYYVNRWRLDREDAKSLARLGSLATRHKPQDVIAVITNQDDLRTACYRSLFAPVNRPLPLQIHNIVGFATVYLPVWREVFAEKASAAWSRGGEVWVSKRAWQEKPLPEWNWVENEDRRVSWRMVVGFFGALGTDGDLGGTDGFFRVQASDANRARLASFLVAH